MALFAFNVEERKKKKNLPQKKKREKPKKNIVKFLVFVVIHTLGLMLIISVMCMILIVCGFYTTFGQPEPQASTFAISTFSVLPCGHIQTPLITIKSLHTTLPFP
jgi:hypothetical protein